MKTTRNKTLATVAAILILAFTAVMAGAPLANAQYAARRETGAFLSVNPHLLGVGQQLLVNLWSYPSPTTRVFSWWGEGFQNVEVTFTKPDGSKDTFMPTGGSGGTVAGETEMIGSIWFHYYPNQVGTWKLQFTMPEQVIGNPPDDVVYEAATSEVVTFVVQQDPVQIGLPPVGLPAWNDYWESPINSDNREWHVIGGGWLQSAYDGGILVGSMHNPYTTAPNTGHIVWKKLVSQAGIVGGPWGSLSYPGVEATRDNLIWNGRLFHNMPGGVFHCIDLRTGELIYEAPGTINLIQNIREITRGAARGTPETQAAYVWANLWQLGSTTWTQYNPLTGAKTWTITNVPNPSRTVWADGDPIVYCLRQRGWNTTIPYRQAKNEFIKWDQRKVTGNDWATGIVWNVSLKNPDGSGPSEGNRGSGILITADRTKAAIITTGQEDYYLYDLSNGQRIYAKNIGYSSMHTYCATPNDAFYGVDSANMEISAYDMLSGNKLWTTKVGEYPWGGQVRGVQNYAYGMTYLLTYDGHIYAMDYTTGTIKWSWFVGETTETPFGNWAFAYGLVIANGKLYVGSGEHSPTQPRTRGEKIYCIDAFTGKGLWNISGQIGIIHVGSISVAEGYLIAPSGNDGYLYCFGKGKTETTVMASPKVSAKGNSLLIEGRVMDMSPAQAGTPAVSDESMGPWMNYLHMQKPIPYASGVWVKLTAVKEDGSTIDIGGVDSGMCGLYRVAWTPPDAGIYTIIAEFPGSESYWPSYGETAISVTAGPSAAPAFKPLSGPAEAATIDVTLIAAAILAIAIITAAIIIRRKK